MPTDFTLPELGENVTAGDVVRVLVAIGDTVAKDQAVLELETDKATIEVPSSVAGTVKEVRIKQGDRIKVGQVVLTLDDNAGAAAKGPKDAKKGEAAAKPKAQPAGAPEEGGISQEAPGAAGGDTDTAGAAGAQKGAAERTRGTTDAPADERFAEHAQVAGGRADEGARPKPRGEVVNIDRGARPAPAPVKGAEESGAFEGVAPPAAPSVRRLARELGVEIGQVPGTGPDGRISVEDVQAFVRAALASPGAGARPAAALPDFTKWGEVERKPMSGIRRKTAEHLSQAWISIPHVTQHDKADITALEGLRKHYSPQAEKAGGKLTMTVVALKIVAEAMRKFPQFNASVDMAAQEIVYKKSIHVGVAVDTPRGLLVPVIRDVDRKGVIELAADLGKASEKARAGKLSLDEMQGAGFTITNLGGIGGTSFTPIVNWPEVAILGISRGIYEPVYDGHEFHPRQMLPLSLSYDHRAIDGADGARFLRWVAEAFEQTFVMLL
ncbi:MAG TPA: 2-oxo acid dehydrogenase subunit E2 [Vicinamibacterales bacterium]|nr:2-oxo acid dehydrogenase subunit E2 [Vicinamibacterales bacterium]